MTDSIYGGYRGTRRLRHSWRREKAHHIGTSATKLIGEIAKAERNFPRLKFKMPDLQQVELIQRDLSEKSAKLLKIREEYVKRLRDEGFDDDEISEVIIEAKDGRPKRSAKH